MNFTSTYSSPTKQVGSIGQTSLVYTEFSQKLLQYYLLLRTRQSKPFGSTNTSWVQQKAVFSEFDSFSNRDINAEEQDTDTLTVSLATYTSTQIKDFSGVNKTASTTQTCPNLIKKYVVC